MEEISPVISVNSNNIKYKSKNTGRKNKSSISYTVKVQSRKSLVGEKEQSNVHEKEGSENKRGLPISVSILLCAIVILLFYVGLGIVISTVTSNAQGKSNSDDQLSEQRRLKNTKDKYQIDYCCSFLNLGTTGATGVWNTTSCTSNSFLLNDGVCDDVTNVKECLFDLGDCCLENKDRKFCLDCTCRVNCNNEM